MGREIFDDYLVDAQIGIKTVGRNDKHSDTHRYPYEATEYFVLERLIDSGFIKDKDVLLDYGCGMARVPIYLNKKVGCRGYGIEFVEEFYEKAIENVNISGCENTVEIVCGRAEKYNLPTDVTSCFFFNPFDVGIMRGVMGQIIKSYEINPRRINLFFYYPQDEYVAFLMTVPELVFVDEIDCTDIKAVDKRRNIIMIFSLGGE